MNRFRLFSVFIVALSLAGHAHGMQKDQILSEATLQRMFQEKDLQDFIDNSDIIPNLLSTFNGTHTSSKSLQTSLNKECHDAFYRYMAYLEQSLFPEAVIESQMIEIRARVYAVVKKCNQLIEAETKPAKL